MCMHTCHTRVVRGARLWSRKSPEDREVETGFRQPTTRKFCQPSNPVVNGHIFLNKKRIKQRKEKDYLRFSFASPAPTPNPLVYTHTHTEDWSSQTGDFITLEQSQKLM